MNLILIQRGYPPAIIKVDDKRRMEYYQALETASSKGKCNDFVYVVKSVVKEGLQLYY